MIGTVLDGHPSVLLILAAGAVALTSLALVMLAPLIYGVVFARRNGPAHRAEALLRAVAEIIAALRRPPR
ncbi:MAG: hypothetical protein KDB47_16040 [Mycobacterium sp.]|jgi:hypothetical protein|nr:hypothetical protein [Mycobacterium sp.]